MRPYSTFLLLLVLLSSNALADVPEVVVSIKPLHSLVATIMQGVAKPILLLNRETEPHHFSLRPSQRRQIAKAELLVWIGPGLEAALSKAVNTSTVRQLQIMQTKLPLRLPARTQHGHDANEVASSKFDPHVWLAPANASHILKVVARALIELDKDHRQQYLDNLDHALARVEQLNAETEIALALKNRRYIAYHDSYQYFENSFGLVLAGAVKNTVSANSGARHLGELHHLVAQKSVNCIVYDTPQPPDIINSFIKSDNTRIEHINPLGADLAAGATLWFDMMQQLAAGFQQCLR